MTDLLNPAQVRYTTSELLSIVETVKEFCNILLGQRIHVYTNHLNFTHKQFNTERVMRWRLLIEEFSPEFFYIKGKHNIVADALSRLTIIPSESTEESFTLDTLAKCFGEDAADLSASVFPLTYKFIAHEQQTNKKPKQNLGIGYA